jgi:hypothetical protein
VAIGRECVKVRTFVGEIRPRGLATVAMVSGRIRALMSFLALFFSDGEANCSKVALEFAWDPAAQFSSPSKQEY